MNSVFNFLADPKVHDSMLLSMIVTSFIGAIRRYGQATKWWQIGWNFFYDWLVGFWSLRQGQSPKPAEAHVQTSEQTATSSKTQDATFTGASDPTPPVPSPAPTPK